MGALSWYAPATPSPHRRRRRSLSWVLLALALSGCSAGSSSSPAPARSSPPSAPSTSLADHTPTELLQPCRAVPAAVAGRVLGRSVPARVVRNRTNARQLRCRYGAVADVTSYPDVRSLTSIVALYLGADRLAHHPVDLPGADGAQVVLDDASGSATLFAKQGFVTHAVVVRLGATGPSERAAVSLATRLVAANRPPG